MGRDIPQPVDRYHEAPVTLLVVVGAAVGAPLRYLTDRAVQNCHDSLFPWGTFTVNVVGSLILGVLAGGAAAGSVPGSTMHCWAPACAGR